MKKNIFFFLFFLLVLQSAALSQNKFIDSLENVLKNYTNERARLHKTTYDKSDTTIAKILNTVAPELIYKGEYEKARQYCDEAIAISSSLGFKKGEYNAYNNTGVSYTNQSDYPKALKKLFKALEIGKAIGIKRNIANTLNNIALVYCMQAKYPEALKINLESLKIREELGDKRTLADSYNNIGMVYTSLGNDVEALKNHSMALKIREELKDKRGLIYSYTNFGNIYNKQENDSAALKNYFIALKLSEELKDKLEIATAYMNIGTSYYSASNFTDALKYNSLALKMQKSNKNNYGIVQCYINAANIFQHTDKYDFAKKYLDSAIELSKELEALSLTRDAYKILAGIDTITGSWQDAYEHHNMYIFYRDSLINEDNTEKIVQSEMQYEFDKKEAATKAEQEKKDLQVQKEMALKALQFEYQKKQAAAKSEEERKQLKYEQQIKEQQLSYEYNQKIALAEAKQQQEKTLNNALAKENNLMQQNSKNESRIRWLMIVALIGFTAFGINYYRSYKQQKAANIKISKQSEELKTLMQEVHHRVKNNLQLISSLLELQGMRLTDETAKSAFEEGQSRVQSIAILHHQLYQHEDLHTIELNTFVAELLRQISIVFKKQGQEVMIENLIPETFFDIDVALPLGLILNELATNTFKYANPLVDNNQIQNLLIEIKLLKGKDDLFTLVYKDNGTGLSKTFDLDKAKSLGLRIVTRLSKQLKGTCDYEYDNGAKFSIQFAQKRA